MKIPSDKQPNDRWVAAWEAQAAQISMETGIYISVGRDYAQPPLPPQTIPHTPTSFMAYSFPSIQLVRIYFIVYGHQFETLPELKRALELKAFL